MKLKPKPEELKGHKPGRPPEKGNLKDISRWAKVINTSDELFEVKFGGEKEKYKLRKETASVYNKPIYGIKVRCIYYRNKYQTFPHRVYTKFNEILYSEKPSSEKKKESTIEKKLK